MENDDSLHGSGAHIYSVSIYTCIYKHIHGLARTCVEMLPSAPVELWMSWRVELNLYSSLLHECVWELFFLLFLIFSYFFLDVRVQIGVS